MNTNLFGEKNTPKEIYLQSKVVNEYKNKKDYDVALQLLDKLIKNYPNNSEPFALRSTILMLQNNKELAINDLTYAINISPKNGAYLFKRGHCYFNIKEFYDAIADFTLLINNPSLENYSYFASDRSLRLISACAVGQWNIANEDISFIPDNYVFYTVAINGKITKQRLQEAIQEQIKII